MQVCVRCLGEERYFALDPPATLERLLASVQADYGVCGELRLYSGVEEVTDAAQLTPAGSYTALLALAGAGKKKSGKKKKNYATPKKNKHRHKNTKLHVLEHYALDGKDGQVERIRKLCTSETCKDKGIFLASHFNRYYCGKCHVTFQRVGPVAEEKKRAPAAAAKKEDEKKEAAAPEKKKGKKK